MKLTEGYKVKNPDKCLICLAEIKRKDKLKKRPRSPKALTCSKECSKVYTRIALYTLKRFGKTRTTKK